MHFISKDILDKEHGRTFQTLFDIRHSGDYEDFVYCSQEMIDHLRPKAEAYINAIRNILS